MEKPKNAFNWMPAVTHAQQVGSILAAALEAVDPAKAVCRHVEVNGSKLLIDGREYQLDQYRRVVVAAFGKAAPAMTHGLASLLGNKISEGVVISKQPVAAENQLPGNIKYLTGNHPIPGEDSLRGTMALLDMLRGVTEDDLVFCLISGGGSALLTAPVEPITLSDLQSLTSLLLASGATIQEVNTLRKHLDRIKGGGLLRRVYPATLISLILSDVMGSPLEVIASGPTVADPSTYDDCMRIIHKYQLLDEIPIVILEVIKKGQFGELEETVKTGDSRLANVQNVVVGDNTLAVNAALEKAKAEGFNTGLLTTCLQGEARYAGSELGSILRQINDTSQPVPRPACLVAGGETTVTIKGSGQGGRNLELALGAVEKLDGLPEVALVTLATDGEDGPTDAAGAWVDGQTVATARFLSMDAGNYLSNNDSYNFFKPLGMLLKPGSTGTNVNDLVFLFAF